ncbi:MAG: alpha-keto acid decarboxylase family protein, partial [Candidatus Omnitrophica bacterium]|nr:alpha-keto acid decarboxylase family protein [Candidatus Omnitrophota bacterium]MBU1894780.1 alpha-keto acid decarboxylase family protein [Candidatus Omnitrophota bacterium]
MKTKRITTVADYLVSRLYEIGVKHIFGVPGDYVLEFFQCLEKSPIKVITNCNELNAGYSADAYARLNGIGAVCVTYGVGGLSLCNAVMGSFAERVPVIVISGSPPTQEAKYNHLLHHTIGDMNRQLEIYEKATAFAVSLKDPAQAPYKIDDAIETCLKFKRPVYIEIPRDLIFAPVKCPKHFDRDISIKSEKYALEEAVSEAAEILNKSKRPVALLGVELHRFNLRKDAEGFINRTGYNFVTTLLGKSIIPEKHSRFTGIYGGVAGWDSARKVVHNADLMISLGALMTDIHLGARTSFINPSKMIVANSDCVRIKNHLYNNISLKDFINALMKKLKKRAPISLKIKYPFGDITKPFLAKQGKQITNRRFYQRMNRFVQDNNVIIAETGDAMFSASELYLPKKTQFVDQAFYLSIGYSVPATLGVKTAFPESRPITFVGDGSFQVTAQELSTICRHRLNPIIFLINNDGYTVERVMMDGEFNDLNMWKYYMLPEVFGWGWGVRVK